MLRDGLSRYLVVKGHSGGKNHFPRLISLAGLSCVRVATPHLIHGLALGSVGGRRRRGEAPDGLLVACSLLGLPCP